MSLLSFVSLWLWPLLPPLADCEHAAQSGQWLPCYHHLTGWQVSVITGFIYLLNNVFHLWLILCNPELVHTVCIETLTAWHHQVSQAHGGLNVLLKSRLHKRVVLFDDALNVPASFRDVPPQSAHQTDIGIGFHKDLHVEQLRGITTRLEMFVINT